VTENETPQGPVAETKPETKPEATPDSTPDSTPGTPAEPVPEAQAEATPQAPAEEAAAIAYTVKEKQPQPGSVVRYVIEVPAETLEAKTAEGLVNLRKTVVVDGFRRGHAPARLLKARFGKDAEKDAIGEIAGLVTEQIVKAESLETLGEPSLHDSKAEEGQPLTLEIDIEVQPVLDVQGYTGGAYEVEVASVTDKQADDQVESIRQASATYETYEDKTRAYGDGDGVTLDLEVTDAAGKRMAQLSRENAFFRTPAQNLPSEVAQALVGKKPDEAFTVVSERTVKNRQGEDTLHRDTYQVTVKEVKERRVPALDDDFAKDVSEEFTSLADLRKRVADDQTKQAEQHRRELAVDKILGHVVEANAFEAPKTMVAAQEYQSIMRDSQQMKNMGMSLETFGMSTETYLATAHANAERSVKVGVLLEAIAKKEALEVTDADVDAEIARMAEAQGRKPLAIRARLEAEKRLDGLKENLRMQKVETFLTEKNTITVVEPKPAPEPAIEGPVAPEGPAKSE
jgi:trigger factor